MNCIDVNHSVVEFLSGKDQLNLPKIVVAAKISLWQDDNNETRFPTKEELLGNVEPTVELSVVDNSKRAIYLGIKKLNLSNPYDILNHLINISNTIVAAEDQEVGVFEIDGKEVLKYYNENLQIESIEINKKDSTLDVTRKLDKIYLSKMDNYAKEEESKKKEEVKPQALTAKERIAAAKAKKDNPNKNTVFKADSNLELNESINEEIKTLSRILPKDIAVELSDSYLQVLANGRVAVGYFKNGMIHLTNYGNKGVAFHEAFHAVFRSSLSNEERESIYEEAKLNYIRPTKADVNNLMLQNNIDANEATKLYYEELLADEFAAFLNNPEAHEYYEEYPSGILGFFKTLLKWIKNIFASNKRTKELFNNINAGNFVDVKSNDSFGRANAGVDFSLVATNILMSDKAIEVFAKGQKNNWSLDKILTELQIPKNQKKLLLDLNIKDREDLLLEFTTAYTYTIDVSTKKSVTEHNGYLYDEFDNTVADAEYSDINSSEFDTRYYQNLTVPGGINYKELEISTPNITPNIKGHAQFSTDNGIGWFRVDEESYLTDFQKEGLTKDEIAILAKKGQGSKTRRVLELQSDLFQKGRDSKELVKRKADYNLLTEEEEIERDELIRKFNHPESDEDVATFSQERLNELNEKLTANKNQIYGNENQFLQLLNKDNNWVTFFIKSIIQDTAKQTITEVQESDVEAKVRELENSGLLKIKCD